MQILVADDEVVVLEALERQLRSWGFEPVRARDGVEAWRALDCDERPPPAVAILAWDLPGLSGLEVCRMLRATTQGASVYTILMAPREQRVDLMEAREAGVDEFMTKPLSARELKFRIAKGIAFREGRPRARPSIPPSTTGSTPPPPSSSSISSRPSITLGGRYRLERKIAEGRVADVWLGQHLSLGVNVAIKFMKLSSTDELDYASFERDARAAAQLRTEHAARVHGHGSYEGVPYLVMEYLGGESLAAHLAARGPLPLDEVVSMVEQIAQALGEAHARGLLHRDVRPENIVRVADPDHPLGFSAKLVDFALVRAALTRREDDPRALVSPSFTSPECLKEEVEPNAALDFWGLAATAFAAATGARPFAGDTLGQVFARVCVDPIPVPSDLNPAVPAWFDAWFLRACARNPENRLTPSVLLSSLRAAHAHAPNVPRELDGEPASRHPASLIPTAPASVHSFAPVGAHLR